MDISQLRFESELERLLAENLLKYINMNTGLTSQVEVQTICGKFRLDLLTEHNGEKIAFECDGREFHNRARDEWRDAMILGTNTVDIIYRFSGSDLVYHLEGCLYVISKWNPRLFSKRGAINLEKLATPEAKSCKFDDDNQVFIIYKDQSNGINPLFIHLERRCRFPLEGNRVFWKRAFNFAVQCGGGDLDDIISQYLQQFTEE